MTPILEISGATKSYATREGSTVALDAASMTIGAGERVALLGRNGAGKSTLIRSVLSLLDLDSGHIRVAGEPITESRKYLAKIGATLEGTRNVHWRLTPYENARYFAGLRGDGVPEERIDELLHAFEIPKARSGEVGKLSTGNKQRVALACALVHDPPLLLLDEPTLGLDLEAVANIKRVLEGRDGKESRAIVITSHDLSFVEDVCERVVVLDSGRVIYDGALDVLRASAAGYTVRIAFGSPPDVAALGQQWLDSVRGEVTLVDGKAKVSFHVAETADLFPVLTRISGCAPQSICDLDVGRTPLDVAYMNLSKMRQIR